MAIKNFDQAAIQLLLTHASAAQRSRALKFLRRKAERELGQNADEPCDRCGCTEYERNDGDLLCSNCGLQHGEAAED